jgi:hypothetical protein
MSKYLVQANYVDQGISGLIKDGASGRRTFVDSLLASSDVSLSADYHNYRSLISSSQMSPSVSFIA